MVTMATKTRFCASKRHFISFVVVGTVKVEVIVPHLVLKELKGLKVSMENELGGVNKFLCICIVSILNSVCVKWDN